MRTAFLIALMIGLSTAAIQQRASPVYQPSVTTQGSTASVNSTPLRPSSPPTTSMPPAPTPSSIMAQPVAQARESLGTDATMMQPSVVGGPSTPSQNYYVYYYPQNPNGQPNSASFWSWGGWSDVGAGVGSLALVVVGGTILYYKYGTAVQSRALRELRDLTADDAARMARSVLRALEKFSNLNKE